MRKDFSLSFKKHPVTKDLITVSGDDAVKQSLKNIVLTSYNERMRDPGFGSNVNAQLFENISVLTIQGIKDNIQRAIDIHEPDVDVISIYVHESENHNIDVMILFTVLNNPKEQSVSIPLARNIR